MLSTTEHHCCPNPACGKLFALVYNHAEEEPSVPVYLSCPYCGARDFFFIAAAAVRRPGGAYLIPLDDLGKAAEA